jgi:hypothetical protein
MINKEQVKKAANVQQKNLKMDRNRHLTPIAYSNRV